MCYLVLVLTSTVIIRLNAENCWSAGFRVMLRSGCSSIVLALVSSHHPSKFQSCFWTRPPRFASIIRCRDETFDSEIYEIPLRTTLLKRRDELDRSGYLLANLARVRLTMMKRLPTWCSFVTLVLSNYKNIHGCQHNTKPSPPPRFPTSSPPLPPDQGSISPSISAEAPLCFAGM